MKIITRAIIWLAVLAILGFGGYRAYQIIQQRRSLQTADDSATTPLNVVAENVTTATLTNTVWVTGQVEGVTNVQVIPKVTGLLERLRLPDGNLLEEGMDVEKGRVIAVIEHSALDAAVKTAKAAVDVARASYERAKVNLDDAQREKTRLVKLFDEGIATSQERDRAVTAYERTLTELSLADAQVKQAEAALTQAQVMLDEATVEAPISGVITKKYINEGTMVGPSVPLVQIAQIDTVKVIGGISERYIAKLTAGKTPARMVVDALPGEEFEGVVYNVGADIDRQTRTVEVELRVQNPNQRLKPGMFARLRVTLESRENVPVVPETALLREGPEVYVYVVNNSIAHRKALKLGLSEGVLNEVVEGLEPGELVVVRGQHLLQEGAEVAIRKE
jgi:RND family efflux transporter MFP subunit